MYVGELLKGYCINHTVFGRSLTHLTLHKELLEQGVEIKIADAPRPFREELVKVGLSDALGSQQFFVSVKKAVEAFEQRPRVATIDPEPTCPVREPSEPVVHP